MKLPKSKLTFQDRLPFILSFFVPVLIMIGIFIQRGIYPFGELSFLRTDLYHQYAPFTAEFMRKLKAGESLSWTWDIGLGSNFVSLYSYYLASPTNWLALLCPGKYVIEFITFWVVIKIGLSGLTFSYYLSKRYQTRNFGLVFFATLYSLSAYMAAYSWNIMWLDCILLAPLVMLGLERLMKEDKCFLYCITLALCIFSNYYISIMICIFLVLYFIVLAFDRPLTARAFLRKVFNFGLYSLLAGCMSGIILIPTIMYLGNTASAGSTFPETLEVYFTFIEMLARHMVNLEVETGLDHWPNIYCGVAVFFLVPLYVMNQKIPYREKITRICLLAFLLISFSTNMLNFIWHGFHYPNSLPCRQSFLYIAVMLCICFEAWLRIESCTRGQIVGSFWGGLGFILLCQQLITDETFEFHHYLVTAIFMGLYALLLYLYRRKKAAPATLAIVALTLIVAESAMNTGITSVSTTNRTSYWANTESYTNLSEQAKAGNDTFFRIEKFDSLRKTKNDGTWADFSTASVFSSTANSNVTSLYKEWGMEGSTNAYCYRGATPLTSALLSVKYLYATDDSLENSLYTLVGTDEKVSMYECTYWLPLGFMLPSDIETLWDYTSGNDIVMQNNFIREATGIVDVFEHKSNASSVESADFDITTSGYYYVAVNNSSVSTITASYKLGENSTRESVADKSFTNTNRAYILDIGWMDAGDTLTLTGKDSAKMNVSVFRLNEEKLNEAIEILGAESFVVDEYTSSTVSGHITTTGGLMYTSIPYEKGWTVYVDSQEVEAYTFADTMLAIPLNAGEHTIELTYSPDGLKEGLLISLVSLSCFLLLVIFHGLMTLSERKKAAKASAENITATETIAVVENTAADNTAAENIAADENTAVGENTAADNTAAENTAADENAVAVENAVITENVAVDDNTAVTANTSTTENAAADENI